MKLIEQRLIRSLDAQRVSQEYDFASGMSSGSSSLRNRTVSLCISSSRSFEGDGVLTTASNEGQIPSIDCEMTARCSPEASALPTIPTCVAPASYKASLT